MGGHPFARGFLTLWLLGVAAFGLFGAFQEPVQASDPPRWVWPLVSLAFAAVALLHVRFSWWLGKNERQAIGEFLEDLVGREKSEA